MIISHHKFQQNTAVDGDAFFSASFHYLLYLVRKNLNYILEFIYYLNLYFINEFSLLAVEDLSIETIYPMVHGFICPFNLLIYTVCSYA
jgi:hypothetical protein